jgi:hypothetical protein
MPSLIDHYCTIFSISDEKEVHLLGQHCPICPSNVKITVFYDAMPCSLVNRYQGLGEVCCLHLQDMGLLLPKRLCTPTRHSCTLLLTDAGGSSETILHTYQITRYHIPEKDHLHQNAFCHIPHNCNFNAYHNLIITVKQLNIIHIFITYYTN